MDLKSFIINSTNLTALFLILAIFQVSGQLDFGCDKIKDCNACIGTAGCSWCKNPAFEKTGHPWKSHPRCNTVELHKKNPSCSAEFLETPSSYVQIEKAEKVIEGKGNVDEIHISPQKAKVRLSVGNSVTLELTYKEAYDKPLDLYYLLDLSATMEKNKEKVANQSKALAQALEKLTANITMGFGSFIDKPVLPFASYDQIHGRVNVGTVKPYGFKNHLSLTNDVEKFKKTVQDSQLSANIDAPEGGLDALIQAIVCEEKIGWRNNSRRMIVIATDGPFHIAGDGKIGGIVMPNDLKCHLDDDGLYTHSTLQDYPSVGALNYTVIKHKAYLIYAVTDNVFPLYQALSENILNSKAALLESDSDNVVELIRYQYETLSTRVKLLPQIPPLVKIIKTRVKCEENGDWKLSDECEKIKPGRIVKFEVTIALERCPRLARGERNKKLSLKFTTFDLPSNEHYYIDLTTDCECNCTGVTPADTDDQLLTETCKGNAVRLKCGTCQCKNDYTGVNCECAKLEGDDDGANKTCADPKCSGRGKCECKVCKCNQGYSGDFCECDDSMCKINSLDDPDCSGRGKCNCGKCECNQGSAGDKCQCPSEQSTCKEPGLSKVCNGHGKCHCNKIPDISNSVQWSWKCSSCDPGYFGKYCELCRGQGCSGTSQVVARCKEPELQECVKCHLKNDMLQNGKIDCANSCKGPSKNKNDLQKYEVKVLSSTSDVGDAAKCSVDFNETCIANFVYKYQEGWDEKRLTLLVDVDKNLICRKPPPYLWLIIGVVSLVLLIGILTLLLWKLFTYLHDTREYQRFEQERAAAKWDTGENPLYSNPMTTFENPSYRT